MGTPSNELIKNGIKYGIPVAALGVSTTNMAINAKRHSENRRFQKKQIEITDKQLKAMENLSNRIDSNTTALSTFKMPEKVYIEQRERPKSPEKKKGFFGRLFSIQDSDYSSNFKNNSLRKISRVLYNLAEESDLGILGNYETSDLMSELDGDYVVNGSPRGYVVNILYHNGILELLVVEPQSGEISRIDRVIEGYCDKNQGSGYRATQPFNNIFHVEMKIIPGTEAEIPRELIEDNFKLNLLELNQ